MQKYIRKRYFLKLLITFATLAAVLIVILSMLLFSCFSAITLENIHQADRNALAQISYGKEYMDMIAQNLGKMLYTNNYMISAVTSTDYDPIVNTQAVSMSEMLVLSNDSIDSIYYYNARLDHIGSTRTGEFTSLDEFYDKDIKNYMDFSGGKEGVHPVPRKIHTDGIPERDYQVYTYIFPLYTDSISASKGAIIVNLKASFLADMILAVSQRGNYTEGPILVCDTQGRVISTQGPESFLSDCSQQEYFQLASSSETPSGSEIISLSGEQYAVTYSRMADSDWIFIGLTPYETAVSEIKGLISLIVAISAIMLAAAFFIAYIVTRKLYRPIEQLDHYVRSKVRFTMAPPKKRRTELEDVSFAFQQIYESATDLESQKRQNTFSRKNNLLSKVLSGTLNVWEETVQKQLSQNGISLFDSPQSTYALVLLSLDSPEEVARQYTGEGMAACFFSIINVVSEVVSTQFLCEGCQIGEESFCFVVRYDQEKTTEFPFEIAGLMEQSQEYIRKIFGFSMSVSILSSGNVERGFAVMYHSLCSLSRYTFVTGKGSIIDESFLDNVDNEYLMLDNRQKKSLLDAIRVGNKERTLEVYQKISNEAAQHSYENMMNIYLQLAYLLYNEYSSSIDLENSNFATILIPFIGKISKVQTKEEVDEIFGELFQQIIQYFNDMNQHKTGNIVEEIQTIIERDYSDKNLSLNSLAQKMDKSPAYIGRLFKEHTNRSVSEYILFVRMEKLRHLLDTTTQPVNVLLDQVGLEKNNYFYTLFKKHFGVPLSSYKRKTEERL